MSFKYIAQPVSSSHYVLPKVGTMKVEAHVFFSETLYEASEEAFWSQLHDAASYEGVIGVYGMPDGHMGFGVPIGCVIVTDNVLIQAGSGYDVSCFTADTRVPLVDGREFSFVELVELYGERGDFYVYSMTPEGKVTAGKANNPRLTKREASLVEVFLDNGEVISCTPDHHFMLRDGTYREAKDLEPGISLMPLYRSDQAGYCVIQHPHDNSLEKMYRVSFREAYGYVPVWPRIVHHDLFKETNPQPTKTNDDPRFLVDMDQNDHIVLHSKNARERLDRGEIWGARAHAHHVSVKHNNHKVVSVRSLPNKHDVYCLTVEKYANFALAAGVFVHNCGIVALKTTLKSHDVRDFAKRELWVREVEKRIATGVGSGRPELMPAFSHKRAQEILRYGAKALGVSSNLCERQYIPIPDDLDLEAIEKAYDKVVPQLGSVGGGNHYVELLADQATGDVFVMVHCGSRGYGWQTANHFFHRGAELRGLPDNRREESWLRIDEALGKEYWAYHNSAANFAIANRHVIVRGIQEALQEVFKGDSTVYYEISHNLVQEETLLLPDGSAKKGFVHRKGATRAFPGGHPDLKGAVWEKTGHPCLIPGCLGVGTRVLMANGFYKNIESLIVGDEVINGSGQPAVVKAVFNRGLKETSSYRSNQFWSLTNVTPDHQHLIGDLSGYNWHYSGRAEALQWNRRDGTSKIRWSSVSDAPDDFVMLLPRQIKFQLSCEDIYINGRFFRPSYDIGYVFGFFLGDGSCWHKLLRGGQANFYLGLDQVAEVGKLEGFLGDKFKKPSMYYKNSLIHVAVHDMPTAQFFADFGKHEGKRLPESLLRSDHSYIRGLYDGMVDSDGHRGGGTKKFTNTSTDCIELFGIIHYLLFGYFPSISVRPPSAGNLINCKIENCNPSYRCTSLKRPQLIDSYQLVVPIGLVHTNHRKYSCDFIKSTGTKVTETYDISLEGSDPSFIANNVIVHNSMYDGAAILFAESGAIQSACSVNHGSGRLMARGRARRELESQQDQIDEDMRTVERTLGGETVVGIATNHPHVPLDECCRVYKDLDEVLGVLTINGIARVANRLYPLANIKGVD